MPCFALFDAQDAAYRDAVLGTAPRLAVEAASPWGWTAYVDSPADVIGMTRLRRLRAGRGPVPAFRHHGRGGGRTGAASLQERVK